MKYLKLLQVAFVMFISHSVLQADHCNNSDIQFWTNQHCCSSQSSHFGNSGYGVTDPSLWYTITTNSYPESVSLSQNRNKGLSEGGVYLSPTGFTIGEKGNYWVNISAVLQNPGEDSLLIPVFLAQNEVFDIVSPEIGAVAILEPNVITSLHGTGIIKNVQPGTRISIVATNGGYPLPQDVKVVGWGISLFKLP